MGKGTWHPLRGSAGPPRRRGELVSSLALGWDARVRFVIQAVEGWQSRQKSQCVTGRTCGESGGAIEQPNLGSKTQRCRDVLTGAKQQALADNHRSRPKPGHDARLTVIRGNLSSL